MLIQVAVPGNGRFLSLEHLVFRQDVESIEPHHIPYDRRYHRHRHHNGYTQHWRPLLCPLSHATGDLRVLSDLKCLDG